VKNWWASDTSLKDNAMEASDATDSFVRNHAGVSDQVRAGHLANLATADLDRYTAYGRANDLNQAKLRADEAASECLGKSSDRLKVEEIQEHIRLIHKK
jgi:hypothetical protein